MTDTNSIIAHIALVRSSNPKGLALFVERANILLGTAVSCPFALAGRIGRNYAGGDRDAAVLLFRSCADVGTSRARRKTGWQL